jgi:hypothetical protein
MHVSSSSAILNRQAREWHARCVSYYFPTIFCVLKINPISFLLFFLWVQNIHFKNDLNEKALFFLIEIDVKDLAKKKNLLFWGIKC